ncbi:hypothetical protein C1H46_016747 [Malus baccata]|uniref:Uncharacterized protein n=1 Tax=Malus baccata TaxID=106549 RepID=A0A540MFW6_MALBA|nr:hypothetical protein C1H46_016747 [Malus baccata]
MLKRWFLQQFLPTVVCLILMSDKPQVALNNAMQAQVVSQSGTLYLIFRLLPFRPLGMDSEAQAALVMNYA